MLLHTGIFSSGGLPDRQFLLLSGRADRIYAFILNPYFSYSPTASFPHTTLTFFSDAEALKLRHCPIHKYGAVSLFAVFFKYKEIVEPSFVTTKAYFGKTRSAAFDFSYSSLTLSEGFLG